MVFYKKLTLIVLLILNVLYTFSQNGISAKLIQVESSPKSLAYPQFPGGQSEFNNFIESNVRYPYILAEIEMEGEVDITFTIDKLGQVKNIEITKGFDPLADKEVIRVLSGMPRWIPATMDSETIDCAQKLTVTFTLTEELRKQAEQMKGQTLNNDVFIGNSLINTFKQEVGSLSDSLHNITQEEIPVDTLLNKPPQYPGGKEALDAYLKANLKYPKRAIQYGIEGRVVFNLIISAEGEISEIMIFKSLFRDCDEEAFYLVKKMPKWIPGLKDGKPTSMHFMLPIPFHLPK